MLTGTTLAALAPGRGAVITGGAGGIGLATARQLAVFGMRRILWAAGDLIENRPALSRWHPDYKEAFATFIKAPRSQ